MKAAVMERIALRDSVEWSCIIAHNEDTASLEKALRVEGFGPVTQRMSPSEEEKEFSAIIRCFLNHRRAWEQASQKTRLSLIMEADFVPFRGFGSFAVPIPDNEALRAVAWLYLCAGRFRRRIETDFFTGSSTAAVAYIVSPNAAGLLLEYAEQTLQTIDPRKWYPYDSYIWPFLTANMEGL